MSPNMNDPTGNGSPAQEDEHIDDEDVEILEDDIEEIIELDDDPSGDVAADLEDMELQGEGAEANVPERDDASVVFSKHTGSVYCISASPVDNTTVVTGGEDDKAYVWSLTDGAVSFECTGHKDSVTSASFSHDGKYVATGDMSGLIQVWSLAKKEVVWSFEMGDMEWMDWHPGAAVLFAGSADGDMWMWKIPSGDTKTFQSHGVACNIIKVLPNGKHACAGYNDGAVKIWDLKAGTVAHVVSGHLAHTGGVTSMDVHRTESLVATGSTDLTAKLTNTSNGKVVATFNCSTSDENEEDSVEAVGFANGLPLLATGTLSGTLTLWDVTTQTVRQQCKHDAGIVRLQWNESTPVVHTCTLDGVINTWDGRTGGLVKQMLGHSAEILDLHLTRNNNHILTAAGDSTARVFQLNT